MNKTEPNMSDEEESGSSVIVNSQVELPQFEVVSTKFQTCHRRYHQKSGELIIDLPLKISSKTR
jgi:hypothetical protein